MSATESGDGPDGADRSFLSIGEVLDLLKGEYPDVTISKIRFLESQGLIDPERTPSGYRKFHQPDVDRLRWILRQQRDNFLPLKVIKEKLETNGDGEPEPGGPATDGDQPGSDRGVEPPAVPNPATSSVGAATGASASTGRGGPLEQDLTSTSLTRDELLHASGLTEGHLAELERYDMVAGRAVAGQVYFDGDALVVARLAGSFAKHGVEARHLRMFKTATEREAGFYEQLVVPLMKQRNPVARSQARQTLVELARLGESMRGAMLRQALREHTEGH
ncbi:MAG TPA: MerR family transcriptional regulator [Acidimicrobiales bacterium]|nr:MerR family transcriptional regulator [Acidimicrobiales bacterium]